MFLEIVKAECRKLEQSYRIEPKLRVEIGNMQSRAKACHFLNVEIELELHILLQAPHPWLKVNSLLFYII